MIRKAIRTWLGIFDIQQMAEIARDRCSSLEKLNVEIDQARIFDCDSIRKQIATVSGYLADEISRNETRFERIDKDISDLKKSLETDMLKADFAHDMVSSLSARINGTFDEYLMKIEYCLKEVEALGIQVKGHQHDDILKAVMEKLTCRRKVVKGAK